MSQAMPGTVAATVTVAATCQGLFSYFVPGDLLRANEQDPDDLRRGQAHAGVASLALGVAVTAATRSPWPLLAAIGVVCLLVWRYDAEHRRGQEGEA